MNSSRSCHEIPDCPNIFVDAFRGHYLSQKTKDADNIFILTHYHGDHYGSLPGKQRLTSKDPPSGGNVYLGPAKIHCTSITAELLRRIHRVPAHLVVEHAYGEQWTVTVPNTTTGRKRQRSSSATSGTTKQVSLTFYDANHCPGAAIVIVEVPTNHTNSVVHVHTGDMRYHRQTFQGYSRLAKASLGKRIDCVLLDTTYATKPSHDFVAQSVAIQTIASQVQEQWQQDQRLPSGVGTKTLFLLSCYSIGKERVLLQVSKETQQPIFVTERKYEMLDCIRKGYQNDKKTILGTNVEADGDISEIVELCTTDELQSDVHVIPMGMAGEMWPFFQPNYNACADYAIKLNDARLERNNADKNAPPLALYNKVVAFIPTGWADATNWNKKNSVSRAHRKCDLPSSEGDSSMEFEIEVEIRLVPYSEHSSYSELQQCIEDWKPRKVIPTVFKDENDRRKVEARFKVDTKRAKQHFFHTMSGPSTESMPDSLESKTSNGGSENCDVSVDLSKESSGDDPVSVTPILCQKAHSRSSAADQSSISDERGQTLLAMGFDEIHVRVALDKCQGKSIDNMVEFLLSRDSAGVAVGSPSLIAHSPNVESKLCTNPGRSRGAAKKRHRSPQNTVITSFFSVKKK